MTPRVELADATYWTFRGLEMGMAMKDTKLFSSSEKLETVRKQFRECHIGVLQSTDTGKVHKILIPALQPTGCTGHMQNMLIAAAKMIPTVSTHPLGHTDFVQKEHGGEDNEYTVGQADGDSHSVKRYA